VRIVALSISDSGECAFVRFLVSHPEQGREILERAGLAIIESDLIGVELPDHPQPLLQVCTALLQAEVNIIQAYPILVRPRGRPAVALMVDNTVASPYLCNPIDWGADVVIHSATKYLGGHGTTLAGVIVESGHFPWDNGKFPGMTEPSVGYHGVKFWETFGDFAFTMRARMENLRVFGATLAPTSAWQILQGIETLPLRMERHCRNALAVARHLQNHPKVSWVHYPGMPEHPQHALVKKQMRSVDGVPGGSGLLVFGVKGGLPAGVRFIESARFMSHLANIGDTRTLIIHPASTTHRQLDEAQQIKAGVLPDMVRMSVGLEHIDDILWDIDQALDQA
jgi:O-acetylhomoserine (thiol)-lyase